jgi:hypothetical protein
MWAYVFMQNFRKINCRASQKMCLFEHDCRHINSETERTRVSKPSLYGSTALVHLDRFFSSLIYKHTVGLLGREISLSQGRYLHRTTQIE